jgi:spore photoproduct lyase
MNPMRQLELAEAAEERVLRGLPTAFSPSVPPHLNVRRIILARGSLATPVREAFVRRVCAAFPGLPVEEQLDTPHNRLDLGERDPWRLYELGKQTLVFGELKNAVRFSDEQGNTCPNYWHFSVYGSCPYRCAYCYLAGTQGVWFSPTVKVYVNLPEIVAQMDRVAKQIGAPTAFYHGKLQDGLALDPLTAYSTTLVPFFASHPFARQTVLTKSASIDRLLKLDHCGHTTLSWSLNPPEIARKYEQNAPAAEDRIRAMQQCAEAGYPVRAIVMPFIPEAGWETAYTEFLASLLARVPLQRLTLGGICSYSQASFLMRRQVGLHNAISLNMRESKSPDGRRRYSAALRVQYYRRALEVVRDVRPDLTISLCMEEPIVWEGLRYSHVSKNIDSNLQQGRCNCVL